MTDQSQRAAFVSTVKGIWVFVLTFGGCLLCGTLVNLKGFYAVPASAGIALVVSALGTNLKFPGSYSLALYAGTFGGMGKIPIKSDIGIWLFINSVIVAVVVLAFEKIRVTRPKLALSGIGGRLGFFGFIGFTLFFTLSPGNIFSYHAAMLNTRIFFTSIAGIYFGATATWILRRSFPADTPHHNVLASAVIGILGSLTLLIGNEYSEILAAGVFLGSFIGMSNLPSLRPTFILLSSCLAAGILLVANMFFLGFGGLLGTVALCSVLLSHLVCPRQAIEPELRVQ